MASDVHQTFLDSSVLDFDKVSTNNFLKALPSKEQFTATIKLQALLKFCADLGVSPEALVKFKQERECAEANAQKKETSDEKNDNYLIVIDKPHLALEGDNYPSSIAAQVTSVQYIENQNIPTSQSIEPSNGINKLYSELTDELINSDVVKFLESNTQELPWIAYYMQIALSVAMRSPDPNTQVGAVIAAQDKTILSVGYNSWPSGLDFSHSVTHKRSKLRNIVHAEQNALLNISDKSKMYNAICFTTMFPCKDCAKLLVAAGVRTVVYFATRRNTFNNSSEEDTYEEAYVFLREAAHYIEHTQPRGSSPVQLRVLPFLKIRPAGGYNPFDNKRLNVLSAMWCKQLAGFAGAKYRELQSHDQKGQWIEIGPGHVTES